LFEKHGCVNCHRTTIGGDSIGPSLFNILGKRLQLENRRWIVRDRRYIATKIRNPNLQVSLGGFNVMPPYKTTFSKKQMNALVSYIVSLRPSKTPKGTGSSSPTKAPGKPAKRQRPTSRPVVPRGC
jgi:cytochrome c551/c552